MRKIFLLSLMAYLAGGTLQVQGQSNRSVSSTPELQLTTEVVGAKFCDSDYLRLELRLRYYNHSNQPVIISRQGNTILTYFISKTSEDAQREKYEQKYSPTQSRIGGPEIVDTEQPSKEAFVILNPATSYEVTTQGHLLFLFDGKDPDPDLLRPGDHVLEIAVQTWPGPRDIIPKLRDRWRIHGYLWSQPIVSSPMAFNIPRSPQIVRCD